MISTQRSASALYRTRPIKRVRRTRAQLDGLLEDVRAVLAEYDTAITIRHLFYREAGRRVIQKTEADYKRLCARLTVWRRSGEIEYGAFVDGTRWSSGPKLFNDAQAALNNTVACYRKNLWQTQKHYVEVWTEKDAIRSIIMEAADPWGLRVFACRGFASLSSLADAADTFRYWQKRGKEVRVLYFGDHDPSGLAIDESAERSLAEDFNVHDVEFRRLAVTPEQILEHDLPTRPVKTSDRRAAGWEGGCVEIDTLKPSVLKQLVDDAITDLIDAHEWEQLRLAEEMERETLRALAGNMGGNS
jgi:hypothetical protein